MKYKIFFSVLLLVFCSLSSAYAQHRLLNMTELHQQACDQSLQSKSPWSISHLYNCSTENLFIPYQLWTGAKWDGDKGSGCEHQANNFFIVDDDSETTITGMYKWANPITAHKENYWKREKVDRSKIQYFTCHEKGIGRVFDSRGERYFEPGRCKFPAGDNWRLGERQNCKDTSIQITEIGLNNHNELVYIDFKWWYKSWAKYSLDYIYRYVPNHGMKYAWKQ